MKLRLYLGSQLSEIEIPEERVKNINEYFEHYESELIVQLNTRPTQEAEKVEQWVMMLDNLKYFDTMPEEYVKLLESLELFLSGKPKE